MFIDVQNIKKSYGSGESRTQVLRGISAEIEEGQMCVYSRTLRFR
jgi:putative ABC transport system ATP-binding protein